MVGPVCWRRLAAHLLRARSRTGVAVAARRASGGAHGEIRYRQFPVIERSQKIKAELGHFPYPDASQWTDEELGIPPDDEDYNNLGEAF